MYKVVRNGGVGASGFFFPCMCTGLLIFTKLIFLMGAEILLIFPFYNVSKILRTLNVTRDRN